MNATDPLDLGWLEQLVKALATGMLTREEVIALLGEDAGADGKGRRVRPRSALLASASVYPLEHLRTPVAMDLVFAPTARPSLDLLAQRLGPFKAVPRAPDDFTSGARFARYIDDTKTLVRVFAEVDDGGGNVAKLFLDAYTRR